MKKVFVVWSIPDYIGIDIEYIFENENDAIRCVDEHNLAMQKEHPDYWTVYAWEYSEYELC